MDMMCKDQDRRAAELELKAMIAESLESGVSDNSVLDVMKRVEGKLKKDGKL